MARKAGYNETHISVWYWLRGEYYQLEQIADITLSHLKTYARNLDFSMIHLPQGVVVSLLSFGSVTIVRVVSMGGTATMAIELPKRFKIHQAIAELHPCYGKP